MGKISKAVASRGNNQKKEADKDGHFQKTLFQCWTKEKISNDSDDIQIIEMNIKRASSTIVTSSSNEFVKKSKGNTTKSELNPNVQLLKKPTITDAGEVDSYNKARKCPFYKRIADTPYVVDAFNYAHEEKIQGYFLSHFHSDHYVGLNSRFTHPIYCSKITANLVRLKLKVSDRFIISLPLDTQTSLPDGTRVQLLNSNHCPGAVLFVFDTKNGRKIVHTGDMRADDTLLRSLENLFNAGSFVDVLHLDTTYCNPKYLFPSQCDVIDELLRKIQSQIRQCPKLLIVVGVYQIGKERVFQAIAEHLNTKIFVERDKLRILHCLDDASLRERLTVDPHESSLHILSMNSLSSETLANYLKNFNTYDNILGIRATGWEYGKKGDGWRVTRRGNATVIGAPYSEHSSYTELKRFVQFIRPRRIIPTVNVGNENSRKAMRDIFTTWMREADQSGSFKQKVMKSFLSNGI